MRPVPDAWQKRGDKRYWKFTKSFGDGPEGDAKRQRLKDMLDHFDNVLMYRFKKAIAVHKELAPWYKYERDGWKSYGSNIEDLKKLTK